MATLLTFTKSQRKDNKAQQALAGFPDREDPKLLQKICNGLTEAKIEKLLRKWLARLPHPFPAKDRAAGFRDEIFMQQVEFARTLVLDKPVSGRTRTAGSGVRRQSTSSARPETEP